MKTSLREPLVRLIVKHPWLVSGVLATIAGIGAVLIVASGVVPIKASSGHWSITARFLDFAKLQSVKTHALGIEAPRLDDEGLVLRGAAHYAIGCEPCHGGPEGGVPPVMAAMTPPPPELTGDRVTRWTSEQLFSIVKHGIKFTGMPAWSAQSRDDEVWAVVAFLRRMPGLQSTEYRKLAYGDILAVDPALVPAVVRELCSRCHGVDGTGRGVDAFPRLAGQRSAYLYGSLRGFADRTRFSGIMSAVAARLDDRAMREVAVYYESLPAKPSANGLDSSPFGRGATIAATGDPGREIPACRECHGPTDQPKNLAYPVLAGQYSDYLRRQLELLKERRRGGTAHVTLMHTFVNRLTEDDIRDVTRYFAALSGK